MVKAFDFMSFHTTLSLDQLKDRISGSIWGMLLGDAFCLGSQDYYNHSDRMLDYPQGLHGFDTPSNHHPYSGIKGGELSPYGQGSLALIRSLLENDCFHLKDYAERLIDAPTLVAAGSDSVTQAMRENYLRNTRTPFDRSDFQEGSNDEGLINITRACPLVAVHANDPELPKILEIFTRVLQQNDRALAYVSLQSRILIHLWSGRQIEDVFTDKVFSGHDTYGFGQELQRKLDEAQMNLHNNVAHACEEFGQGGLLVSAFPCCIHNFLRHKPDWRETFMQCALAGGDSTGRASLMGSWLGAAFGRESIPEDWFAIIHDHQKIDAWIHELMHLVA